MMHGGSCMYDNYFTYLLLYQLYKVIYNQCKLTVECAARLYIARPWNTGFTQVDMYPDLQLEGIMLFIHVRGQ